MRHYLKKFVAKYLSPGLLGMLLLPLLMLGQDTHTDLGTQYQVHLGGFSGNVLLSDFNNLQDLGILTTECIQKKTNSGDGLTHVYLGIYLGKNTAEKFLNEVKNRGYNGAALVSDQDSFNGEAGKKITSAIQIELQNRPDLSKLQNISVQHKFYVKQTGGGYQVLTLLHNPIERTPDFKWTLDYFVDQDYDAFPVKFR